MCPCIIHIWKILKYKLFAMITYHIYLKNDKIANMFLYILRALFFI